MRVFRTALGMFALSLLSSVSTAAQSSQPYSAQLSVLSTGIVASGGVINGYGLEPQLRVNGKYFSGVGRVSIGLGGQYTSHKSANDIGITIVGAFVEPRLVIARIATDKVSPYVALRLAALRQSNDVASSSNGFAVGAGGGIAFRLSERLNLDVGIAGIREKFSESVTTADRPFISGSMSSYAAKVGVNIGFGK